MRKDVIPSVFNAGFMLGMGFAFMVLAIERKEWFGWIFAALMWVVSIWAVWYIDKKEKARNEKA